MQALKRRWFLLLCLVLVIGAPIAWYKWPSTASAAEAALTAPVKQGDFKVAVTTTGELRARKFVEVQGPTTAQTVNVYQTKITWMVPEGTVVKAGDKIADLDRGPAATRMADVNLNLQKAQADFTTAELDSALNLAQSREDVRTAQYQVEEDSLAEKEAQYEAPTVKRKAEISLEKSRRALNQAKVNLDTKTKQAVAKMVSVSADLGHQQNQLKMLTDIMGQFTVNAPSSGMVIYVREWNGKKRGVGSAWSPWDPAVATLPDLTEMASDTYVNEVDVRRVSVGQEVLITLDADPSKKLKGKVTEVANVGEQRPNQDSKVFEVKIDVLTADSSLRPGMTTANAIETASLPNVLSVPLEAVVTDSGSSYVYKKDGIHVIKQQIVTGMMNDNEIVVERGLSKDDRVLLSAPTDKASIKTALLTGVTPKPPPATGSDTATGVPLHGKGDSSGTKAGGYPAKGDAKAPAPAPAKPGAQPKAPLEPQR